MNTEAFRGPVVSDRFEVARNFGNKLWNASRFAMINLHGMQPGPISEADLTLEDRWMLSRLATVCGRVTDALQHYRFAEASRELYDFAWDEFCSFYVEMLKDRFADEGLRTHAQRMLAFTLDNLLRLLHPIIPFITEEIWQLLLSVCPERGFAECRPVAGSLCIAQWPTLPPQWQQEQIEQQFACFQNALGAIREIRSTQNLPPRTRIEFAIQCDHDMAALLQPMTVFFESMAKAELTGIGPDIEPPRINAAVARQGMEIFVSLAGLIDVEAEKSRLNKEKSKVENAVQANERKLGDEKFIHNAPEKIVMRTRENLADLKLQLAKIEESLEDLAAMK